MPPPKHGGSGTSKPFAVSFSNTSRKPLHTPPQSARPRVSSSLRHHRHHISHDESDEEEEFPVAEEVTGFDMGGAISKNAPKEKEPLVIKVESRNNWRDRPGTNRRSRNLLPQEVQAQAAGNVAVVETETPSMTYGLSLAPAQNEGADERQSDVAMANTAPISEPEPRAPLTQDEIALQALIRESEGGETTRRSDLVIESTRNQGRYDEASSFRADVATRPDQASLDAYEAVPVEEFGAALLRGMGWKEGQAIGRGDYGDTTAAKEARVPARRPGFLGIGAKDIGGAKGAEVEIGAWGKAAMRKGSRKGGDGSGSTEGVYMPVVMKSKTTGECLTEEEFKLRQKEPSERKANGRSDERSSHSNGRDKELSRRYDNERGDTISEEIEVDPLGLMIVAVMMMTRMMANGLLGTIGCIVIGTIMIIKAGDDLGIEVIVILDTRDGMKIIVPLESEIVIRIVHVQIGTGTGTGIVTDD
ncbi:G-patch domain protein (Spp2), putative [Talaromyces marneffei ATCC 18224]|uniref:Pre-mRNA-splicing factor n=1 Tax=Talaromyces marneffei (strain ATCC 18224 / CBS 334.59 / QM 7333) TaxID=441960 RepID=B6QHE9_TALMQ|nr:G-patch domain protein (Spp2), putative [Talaromyces marneffei ATCC 18224]